VINKTPNLYELNLLQKSS